MGLINFNVRLVVVQKKKTSAVKEFTTDSKMRRKSEKPKSCTVSQPRTTNNNKCDSRWSPTPTLTENGRVTDSSGDVLLLALRRLPNALSNLNSSPASRFLDKELFGHDLVTSCPIGNSRLK